MIKTKRIYHSYEAWEDYHAGFHRNVSKSQEKYFILQSKCLLSNKQSLLKSMISVISHWRFSCEENLTNGSLNKVAYLGQAACLFNHRSPEYATRKAWHLLTKKQQLRANSAAASALLIWKNNNSNMKKKYLNQDVCSAAKERIARSFDLFEKIYVSFSGGKDSTVMLHLVMEEAIKRKTKVGVMFVDLEGQYKLTIDHVKSCYDLYAKHITPYWCCLPIHLRNAVSVYETHWVCWEGSRAKDWVRQMPEDCINEQNHKFPFFHAGMEFEEFVPKFGEWYAEGRSCGCFVGIRTDESLNRYRTIASKSKVTASGYQWTTKVTENVFNIYPIYDWKVQDLWIYHSKNKGLPHNKLYDLMHRAGLTLSQMRICQPYGDDQRRGLWLFHLIEPETWARVVARVNGANSGALYVQDTGNINGYRRVSKPNGHTWESFCKLLMSSMPPKTMTHYENKVAVFRKWWMDRGYPDGIPDEADPDLEAARKVPSWRRVCKSLLRNDYWCKGLSFTQHKSEAYEKYLTLMKRRRENWRL